MISRKTIVNSEALDERNSLSGWLLPRLRRVTTSGRFIPEVDGLRFFAIALVFLFHVYGRVLVGSGGRIDPPTAHDLLVSIVNWGGYGVLLFFVISGFILGLPFAEHYLADRPPVSLKAYFKRRLFRLEPPYIICILLMFAGAMLVAHGGRGDVVRHFLATITYTHNLIYRSRSTLNPVAWSLEVEVQFYILAPLLMKALKFRSAPRRCLVLLLLAMPSTLLAFRPVELDPAWWKLSIVRYLPYFLMGILLADWYVTQWKRPPRRPWLGDLLATSMVILAWRMLIGMSAYEDAVEGFLSYVILAGCVGVFRGSIWRRILANPWLAAIGGMCYTIYLYHKPMLHALHPLTQRLVLTRIFWVNLSLQLVIFTALVLPIMAMLFVLFEKPFMYRDWPARFSKWLKGTSGNKESPMPLRCRLLVVALFYVTVASPFARGEPQMTRTIYSSTQPSDDGIGKVYMGREIAFVMGHQGIHWLERPTRELEEQPRKAIELMELKETDVVADIGAGSGYFSFRMAAKVPKGKVLAVDIQQEMLDEVNATAKKKDIKNVEAILGTIEDPNLPKGQVDVALMVDAYHEFDHPREMMLGIVKGLKPGGRVVLVEYRAEDPNVMIKPHHKMTQEQAKKEMAAVGLVYVKTSEELPQQHLMVFEKPAKK